MSYFNSIFNKLADEDKSELLKRVTAFFSEKLGSEFNPNLTYAEEKQQFMSDMFKQFSAKESTDQPGYRTLRRNPEPLEWPDESSAFAPWEFFRARFGLYPWQIMKRWFGGERGSRTPRCCGPWF